MNWFECVENFLNYMIFPIRSAEADIKASIVIIRREEEKKRSSKKEQNEKSNFFNEWMANRSRIKNHPLNWKGKMKARTICHVFNQDTGTYKWSNSHEFYAIVLFIAHLRFVTESQTGKTTTTTTTIVKIQFLNLTAMHFAKIFDIICELRKICIASSYSLFSLSLAVSSQLHCRFVWGTYETNWNISLNLHTTMGNLVALALNENLSFQF